MVFKAQLSGAKFYAMLDWGLDTPFTSQDRPPLAIAITATVDGPAVYKDTALSWPRKPSCVLARKSPQHLHRGLQIIALPRGFFPCSIDREFLYGYAADGFRSPLWICAAYDGDPVLVHRQRGTRLYFHQAIYEKKIIAIPAIHYFDAHPLEALLLTAP